VTASAEIAKASVRRLACEILLKVDTRKSYADILLDQALKTQSLSERDRSLLTELVYGTLRWRGKIDAQLSRHLRRPLEQDLKLKILTDKDPDSLFVFRHSAAHLLAAAVMELYPDVKLGIGPPVDTGFFYEFMREQPFTPDDLVKIEKKMHELAAQDLPNERKYLPKPEALEFYKKSNQMFKCELVEEKSSWNS